MVIVHLVHECNRVLGSTRIAYTFDAGPNAVVLCEQKDLTTFHSLVRHYFPTTKEDDFVKGRAEEINQGTEADKGLLEQINAAPLAGAVEYLIVSALGAGAKKLSDDEAVGA